MLNCKLSLSAGELSASLRNQLVGLKDRVQQEYNRKSGNKSSLILFYSSNSTIYIRKTPKLTLFILGLFSSVTFGFDFAE